MSHTKQPTPRQEGDARELDDFWLPDFCSPAATRRLIAIALLMSVLLLVAQTPVLWPFPFWDAVIVLGMICTLIAVSFAHICQWRRRMAHWSYFRAAVVAVVIIEGHLIWVVFLGLSLHEWMGLSTQSYNEHPAFTILRYMLITAIFAGLFMRYLTLQARLREREKAALQARLEALQARIQPHFLFNSMNIIASLIVIDPVKAEQAVEDLAALFRASLRENGDVSLAEELALCRRYANIEQLRLGDRMQLSWKIPTDIDSVRLPQLTLQPLLENAIRHGVELFATRCDISLVVEVSDERVEIVLSNPLPDARRTGNQMSVRNVSERLRARFGNEASLQTSEIDNHFVARVSLPRLHAQGLHEAAVN